METNPPLQGENPETPHQESQRTCTRNSPCRLQGCPICCTPTNHVRNLEGELSSSEAIPPSPTDEDLPQPPHDHFLQRITLKYKRAIQKKNLQMLETLNSKFIQYISNNEDYFNYNVSDLETCHDTAIDLLKSEPNPVTTTTNTNPNHHQPTPSASFKPPKLIIESWDGQSYNFYPWLTSVLKGFELAQCDDPGKLHHTLHAIPLNKRGSLNHITNWNTFKTALIEEFGSINVFGRDVNQVFENLTRYESVQEVAEDLAPKIKTLQSNLDSMTEFHKLENLHNVALTQSLVKNIMRSLPLEVRPSFNDQLSQFREKDQDNVQAPATFFFLAQFVNKLKKSYQSDPGLYDLDIQPLSIGVKPVRPVPINSKPRQTYGSSASPSKIMCPPCTVKGFQADHYPLSYHCGVSKLSSQDIIKIISDNHLCPTCMFQHDLNFKCKPTYPDGKSKVCPRDCKHDELPLHRKACMHSNQAPYISVSRVSVNKSVPLVEDVQVGKVNLGIQYDTGCQMSLISKSALSKLPPSMYSLGKTSQIKVITYAGEGKTILTTAVKLRLPGKTLKLSTIEEDLNHGTGFSFPIPRKWRSFTGTSTSHHTGRISILLGGDNHLFFPTEIERNPRGIALYQSNLTQSYMVYGSIPSNTITWVEPLISSSNQIRRSTKQSRRETGGEAGTFGRNREKNQEIQEKNQNIRKRNRRRTRNCRKKPEGKPDTPTAPKPPTNPNPPTVSGNPGTLERNRRRTRNFRKISEGEPDTPTTPELPANLNPPQETIHGNPVVEDTMAAELAQEQSNQLHPAQDEFHADPASTEQ